MPIILAPIDVELTITKIAADGKLKKHLESLGITVNSKIKVLSQVNGSVIVLLKKGRLALDKNVAVKIFVA